MMPLSFLEILRTNRFFSRSIAALLVVTFCLSLYQCSYISPANQNVKVEKLVSPDADLVKTTEQQVAFSLDSLQQDSTHALQVINQGLQEQGSEQPSKLDKALGTIGLNELEGADLSVFKAYRAQADENLQQALESFETVKKHLEKHDLAPVMFERHQAAVETYQQKHAQLVGLLDEVLSSYNLAEQQAAIETLNAWLKDNQQRKAHQQEDFDRLPFHTPEAEVREPEVSYSALLEHVSEPQLLASTTFDSSMLQSTLTDLDETIDAPHSDVIKSLAQELNHDPIAIYNWVYNNIQFVPSYGSIQGAEYTLRLRQGNAMDTSSLLIALLRASGIHARYAYGTVEVPAEKAMNWVGGVNSPEAAARLMGQGGIPTRQVVSGGQVVALKFEHTWVEAFIDYEPSRGLKNIEADAWIPLDASYKQYEFAQKTDLTPYLGTEAEAALNTLLASATSNTQQGWIQGFDVAGFEAAFDQASAQLRLDATQEAFSPTKAELYGAKHTRVIPRGPLSSHLPYKLLAQTESFNELPEQVRHKFMFRLESTAGEPLYMEQPTVSLAGKKIALNFVPASQEDTELIRSYFPKGEKTNKALPAYLINMKAQLSVNDLVIANGAGFTMGEQTTSTMGLWSPARGWLQSNNSPIVGESHAVALDLQGVSTLQLRALSEKMEERQQSDKVIREVWAQEHATDILYATILSYFYTNNSYDKADGRAADIVTYRAPSYGVFQTSTSVTYWYGMARELKLSGLVMDVDNVSFQSVHVGNDNDKVLAFRANTGARLSLLENKLPESIFGSDANPIKGISTTQALVYAIEQNQKIYTLTSANAEQLANITINDLARNEIVNALHAGKVVTVHEKPLNIDGWVGSGYLILDEATGGAAYKIAGGQNGGSIPYDDPGALLAPLDIGDEWFLSDIADFGDWLLNHSNDSIIDYYGEDSAAALFWDFFLGGYLDAINAARSGDLSDAATEALIALLKLKLVDKAIQYGQKLPPIKAINNKAEAIAEAVKNKMFDSLEAGKEKLQSIADKFKNGEVPPGATSDPNYPNRLEVPVDDKTVATYEYNPDSGTMEMIYVDRIKDPVWDLKPTKRGEAIEKSLADTEYKDWYNIGQENNGYFPLVDFQKDNTLVSLKTVDTSGSSWMGDMKDHIRDFGRREATVDGVPANKVLDIRVEPGGVDAAADLIQYGQDNGVTVIIKEF